MIGLAGCYAMTTVTPHETATVRVSGQYGSVIAGQYGIFEASRYLRHSDIRITAAFYADKKQRVIPDLT